MRANNLFELALDVNVAELNWNAAPRVDAVREISPLVSTGCWLLGVDGRRVFQSSSVAVAFDNLKSLGAYHPDTIENVMVILLHLPDTSWFALSNFDVFQRCKGVVHSLFIFV